MYGICYLSSATSIVTFLKLKSFCSLLPPKHYSVAIDEIENNFQIMKEKRVLRSAYYIKACQLVYDNLLYLNEYLFTFNKTNKNEDVCNPVGHD